MKCVSLYSYNIEIFVCRRRKERGHSRVNFVYLGRCNRNGVGSWDSENGGGFSGEGKRTYTWWYMAMSYRVTLSRGYSGLPTKNWDIHSSESLSSNFILDLKCFNALTYGFTLPIYLYFFVAEDKRFLNCILVFSRE